MSINSFVLVMIFTAYLQISVDGQLVNEINGKYQEGIGKMIYEGNQQQKKGTAQRNDITSALLRNHIIVYNLYSELLKNKIFNNAYQRRRAIQNMKFVKKLLLIYTDYLLHYK